MEPLVEITQNDPFASTDDPFKDARAPIRVVEKTNERQFKAIAKVLESFDADREKLRLKYVTERKKFEAVQLKYARARLELEGETKLKIAAQLAKAEKQRLADEAKKKKKGGAALEKVEFPSQGVLDAFLDDEEQEHHEKVALASALGGVVHHVPDGEHSLIMSFVDDVHPGQGAIALGGAAQKQQQQQQHQQSEEQRVASAKAIMLHLRRQGKEEEAAQVEQAYKFSDSDPGWADAFFEWLKDRDMLQHNYYMHTHLSLRESFVYEMPENISIGIIGDWGTGNLQSKLMIDLLMQQLNPAWFIHLGDVYYAGTKQQFQDFYLKPLMDAFRVSSPLQLKGRVWTLPGNHDYYAGGGPFFDAIDQIGSHRGSYFCLTNSSWSLIGLDTCLNDANPVVTARGVHCTYLPPEQLAWAKQQIDDAKQKGKGVILMSHHMLFSQHETTGKGKTLSYTNERLYEQFASHIGKIDCWYWGHEHSWTKFAPYRGLKRGRLLGNGGVPVLTKENMYSVKPVPGMEPPKPLSKPPSTFTIKDSLDKIADLELWCNGLYLLELNGKKAVAKYHELHQKNDGKWTLEEIQEVRDEFRAGE